METKNNKTNQHSSAEIFICPHRIFIIQDGYIPSAVYPVDYWTEEGRCSYCKEVNMAKSTVKKIIEITLTEEEAIYLKALLQNYLGSGKEDDNSLRLRRAIWDALKYAE